MDETRQRVLAEAERVVLPPLCARGLRALTEPFRVLLFEDKPVRVFVDAEVDVDLALAWHCRCEGGRWLMEVLCWASWFDARAFAQVVADDGEHWASTSRLAGFAVAARTLTDGRLLHPRDHLLEILHDYRRGLPVGPDEVGI